MRKSAFSICENKEADQLRGNREADQRLCFHYTVQSLYFLNMKFQASSHLVWLYCLVCVGSGQKPRRPVFSQRGSIVIIPPAYEVYRGYIVFTFSVFIIYKVVKYRKILLIYIVYFIFSLVKI